MKATYSEIKNEVSKYAQALDMNLTTHNFINEVWVEAGFINDNIPACLAVIQEMLSRHGIASEISKTNSRYLVINI